MDLTYFKEHIEEEIQGAIEYRTMAEECPEFADTFQSMANDEMHHATLLTNILHKQANDANELYQHFKEKMNG